MITSNELRQKYLDFFKSKGHTVIPSASLIPENDPTALFTTAGMHPLVPYLLGEPHPAGCRLVNVQKCVRTGDIDEVGDASHLTFFEMLGNWSLNDYFKKETIAWSWEFLTSKKYLGVDPKKLAVTVFGGDERFSAIPKDDEAAELWQGVGVPKDRIAYMPGGVLEREDNWWGPAGQTGPCGPSSEIFFWQGPTEFPPAGSNPYSDKQNWLEIWNDVFLHYSKNADGTYSLLKQKNIDTGMGLERTLAVLNNLNDVFLTDIFRPIIQKIEELSGKKYADNKKEFRIIADHIKAAIFILADGVVPSNVEQGYVLRRLIRRAVRYGRSIGLQTGFISEIAKLVREIFQDGYPELAKNQTQITDELIKEENKFNKALDNGLKQFETVIKKHGSLSGKDAFDLFQSHGFPLELTYELAAERGLQIDQAAFSAEFKKHQEMSRAGAEKKFSGGLADHSEMSVRYHTATHLLHQALRRVLGNHVAQKGSNITSERLRFDFSHSEKMTDEQIQAVENIVNEQIIKDLPIFWRELTVEEAKQAGAIGLFGNTYAKFDNKVKVYFIGDNQHDYFSKEICGGPHLAHTGLIGKFKIIKEEAVAAGIRRIKATVKPPAKNVFELAQKQK